MTARILVLSPWPSFWVGGPGVGCADQIEIYHGLVRAGYEIHYVLPGSPGKAPPGTPSRFHPGPDVLCWGEGLPNLLRRPLRYVSYLEIYTRLGRAVAERVRPHLVVGESYHAARAASRVARRMHLPCVTKFYGLMSLGQRRNADWLHRLRHWETIHALRAPAERVVVLDDGTLGDQAALRYGVPRERLCFWPNGLDKSFRTRVSARDRDAVRRGARCAPGDVLIAGVSRLVDNKRADLALEALSRLDPSLPWRYVMVGDGPERAGLEAQAARLGLSERVTFVGAQPGEEVFEWLKAADIFLSTSDLTNRSLTTTEAMMCGLPVVATDSGSTCAVVAHERNGFVTLPRPEALALPLTRLIQDPRLRRAQGRQAWIDSASFPGWEERIRVEIELYQELLSQQRRPSPH